MILFEKRASTILYHIAKGIAGTGKFLLPANVCPVVPLALSKAGCVYELVDISPTTMTMDESAAERMLYEAPMGWSALLFVRSYGCYDDKTEFFARLKKINPNLLIVDDRCLMAPAFPCPDFAGADVLLYSTGYAKIVDIGWGGYAYSRTPLDYRQIVIPFRAEDWPVVENLYKQHLSDRTPFSSCDGDWLDTRHPEMGFLDYERRVEEQLPMSLAHRQKINEIYYDQLPKDVCLAESFQWWRFNILVPEKGALLQKISSAGLYASSHYASLGGVFAPQLMPNAERIHAGIINLFNDFHFNESMALCVAGIVNRHLDEVFRRNNP